MPEILLSFCIPTYNKPEKLFSLVKEIISYESNKIEILIGDDNPLDNTTHEFVKKLTDSRIRYFKNKKNLRTELNLLKLFRNAKGRFIYYISDDDHVEVKAIPWLLKKIPKNNNITQYCGVIGDKRPGKKRIYYEFGEGLVKRGFDSILKLLFYYGHGSAVVIRKDILDLDKAIKYCYTYAVRHYLVAQAMLSGDTLCTSQIFAYKGLDLSDRPPLYKEKVWWHPLSGLIITKYRIKIVNELLEGHLKNYFLEKQKQALFSYLFNSIHYKTDNIFKSFSNLMQGISTILTIRDVSISLTFWIKLVIEISFRFFRSSKYKKLNYIFQNLKKSLTKVNYIYPNLT